MNGYKFWESSLFDGPCESNVRDILHSRKTFVTLVPTKISIMASITQFKFQSMNIGHDYGVSVFVLKKWAHLIKHLYL